MTTPITSAQIGSVELQGTPLTIPEVYEVANSRRSVSLTDSPTVLSRLQQAAEMVREAVDEGRQVYGVTTGFGGLANVVIPPDQAAASQNNLLAFLRCAAGPPIDRRHTRAAMLLRANMLLRGVSGVRPDIVQRLVQFLQRDAIPVVRELGSIGASGDLVPLAAIARAITGMAGGNRVVLQLWR